MLTSAETALLSGRSFEQDPKMLPPGNIPASGWSPAGSLFQYSTKVEERANQTKSSRVQDWWKNIINWVLEKYRMAQREL